MFCKSEPIANIYIGLTCHSLLEALSESAQEASVSTVDNTQGWEEEVGGPVGPWPYCVLD